MSNQAWYNHMCQEVQVQDCYRFRFMQFKPRTESEITIIDIGANVGAFSVMASNRYPNAKIYSYELMKNNYDFLIQKVQGKNVTCFNEAVIGSNTPVGVYEHPHNPGGHKPVFGSDTRSYLGESRFTAKFAKKEVSSVSFSEVLHSNQIEKVDFLKLDCEGSEYEIFYHIQENQLWDKIHNISFEIHGCPEAKDNLLSMLKLKYHSVTGGKVVRGFDQPKVHCRDLIIKN
jgi:FkbM family methyltransferase